MWWLKVFAIVLLVDRGDLISTSSSKDSLEMLWNLTSLALHTSNLQGRQGGYGGYAGYAGYPPQGRPGPPNNYGPYPHYPPGPLAPATGTPGGPSGHFGNVGPDPASIMDVLHSVAQNDELHCVPKLLCELTSNTRSESSRASLLPFNVNMDSLLGLFSALGPVSNPLFLFGRAALLGYSSRGSSCYSAFSRCPNDPDQLVNYLNNYNGGFFRYFNGNPRPHPSLQQGQYYPATPQHQGAAGYPQHPQHPQQHQGYPQQYYRPGHQSYGLYAPQKRILINPTTNNEQGKYPYRFPYAPQYDNYDHGRLRSGIRFPSDNDVLSNSIDDEFYTKQRYKSAKTLTFPDETSADGRYYQQFRAGKTLSFPDTRYGHGLDFQMVRPNHIASPHIFPTRTGTGELLLDTEELY